MSIVREWLAPYEPLRNTQAFLDAVGERKEEPGAEMDADAFFQSLLGPVDEHNMSTQVWTTYFTDQESLTGGLAVKPEAAVAFRLQHLLAHEEVRGEDAATLAEGYFKSGRQRPGEMAAAVAYLGGDRAPSTLVYLAGTAIRAGRTDAAEALIAEARTLHPKYGEVTFCEAVLLVAKGDLAAAEVALRGFTATCPEHRPAWKLLMNVLALSKNWTEVVNVGKQATHLHSRDPALWEQLSRAYEGLDRLMPATRALREAIRVAQKSVGVDAGFSLGLQLELARLEEKLGHPEEALKIYRALLASGRTRAVVYLNASTCLKSLGKAGDAAALLQEGLKAHLDHPDLLSNLGEILFEAERDREAFELLQRAVEVAPARTGNIILMAALCLRGRRYDDAVRLASHVAQTDPERVIEALVLIGDAYRFNGAPEAALEAYREALKRDPEQRGIAQRIESLEGKISGSC